MTVDDTDPNETGDQKTLTFTPSTWDTAQTVRVRAAEDDDTADESATLSHTASGGGYGTVTGNVSVKVDDGTNVPATFGGTLTGAVTEDDEDKDEASGTVTVTDSDGADTVQAQTNKAGTYGTFSIKTNGEWEYELDNEDDDTNALAAGATAEDAFAIAAADGTAGTVTITVTGANDTPTADAGADATVAEGATVTLDGTGTDPDASTTLTYSWARKAGETDNAVALTNANKASASFTAPDDIAADATLTFVLTVSDGTASATDEVVITVTGANDDSLPTKVTNLQVSPGDGSLSVSWTAASVAPNGYSVRWRVRGQGSTLSAVNTVAGTSFTIPNLIPGTTYVVRVDTRNAADDGVQAGTNVNGVGTPIGLVFTDEELPPPENLRVTGGDRQVTATWDAVDGAQSYELRYRKKGPDEEFGDYTKVDGATEVIENLESGTTYIVRVRAVAGGRRSREAGTDGTTNSEGRPAGDQRIHDAPPPNAAPVLTSPDRFTVAENEQVVGRVIATDDDTQDTVTYAIVGGADRSRFTMSPASNVLTLTFDARHTPDFEQPGDHDRDNLYELVIEATSGAGDRVRRVRQNVVVRVTDANEAPAAPDILSLTGHIGELAVSWTMPDVTGKPALTGYEVAYRAGTETAWTDAGHRGTDTSYTITGLLEDTTYAVRVRAQNDEGKSPWSAEAKATTLLRNAAPVLTSPDRFTVAENEQVVGRVIATDDDTQDTVTYAIVGGADRSRFTMSPASNVLTLTFDARHTPDFEQPGDHDRDNLYELVIEATSGAGDRVRRVRQNVVVRVTDANEAPAAPDILSLTGHIGELAVSWTMPDVTGKPALTGYEVAYRAGTETAWTDAGHRGTDTSYTITGLLEDTTYAVRVRAQNDEGKSPWSAEAKATTPTTAHLRDLIREIESRSTLALVDGISETIAERIRNAGAVRAPALQIAGHDIRWTQQPQWWTQEWEDAARFEEEYWYEDRTPSPAQALGGTSFVLPLGLDEEAEAPARMTLWGRGVWKYLSGATDRLVWDGSRRGAQLGIDTRLREDVLAGVALSWFDGGFEYDGDGLSGEYANRMTSVHPWAAWSAFDGLDLWASIGYGKGEVEIDDAGVGPQASNTTLKTLSTGASGPLLERDTMAVLLKGEGVFAEVDVAGGGALDADDVRAARLRVAVAGNWSYEKASGSRMSPSLEVGVRVDGGHGAPGAGMELGAGVEFVNGTGRLSLQMDGYVLVVDGDVLERGLSGGVHYAPDRGGRGLSLRLQSDWGEAARGIGQLWETEVAGFAENTQRRGGRVEAELGYGFGLGTGLLTPYGRIDMESTGEMRCHHIGSRYSMSSWFELRLEGAPKACAAESSILLEATLGW